MLDLHGHPALRRSRDYSRGICDRLEADFADRQSDLAALLTVTVAGSLGRLEATPHSDVDCILVARDEFDLDSHEVQAAVASVFEVFGSSDLKQPKSWGIYRAPIAPRQLCDPGARGKLSEAPEVFGKRIQLLLDARPLYDHRAFNDLRRDILDWYAAVFVAREPRKQWTYLINDLVRYLHSYAAWQQFKFERTREDSWMLRQSKLRGSRVITVAGLLFLLGESSTAGIGKLEWLEKMLDLTPLERLAAVYETHDDDFSRVLKPYEMIHARLAGSSSRSELIGAGPGSIDDFPVRKDGVFGEIRAASNEMISALLDFLFARRGQWDEAFFRYLIF